MKSIMMAVLLIAAGTGVYFLFLNKKKTAVTGNEDRTDLIIGKWKLDSLSQINGSVPALAGLTMQGVPGFTGYSYQFEPDGKLLRLFNDSVQKETASYEWTNDKKLLLRQSDSARTLFIVSKLSKDSLILQSVDSTIAFFSKTK